MSVLKWLGLGVVVIGLLAAASFAFGSTSYSFSFNGQGSPTNCGSLLLPKHPDDALCNELRADNKPWLGYSVIVSTVGLVGFLIARRARGRHAVEPPKSTEPPA